MLRDQYISAGGQLYELTAGHDRFIADLRPLLESVYAARGLPPVIAAHPYDLCTLLVAREAGVIVVAPTAAPFAWRSTPTGTLPGSATRTARCAGRSSPCSSRRFNRGVCCDSRPRRGSVPRPRGGLSLFEQGRPISVARAPGRLDLMGGIADYSGSLVLEMPIRAAAHAAVQSTRSAEVVAVSGPRRVNLPANMLTDRSFVELSRLLATDGGWAAYVLGPVAVLARHERLELPGLRILISSGVPEGRGVSSSAAVEVATIHAVAACLGRALDGRRLALLAQQAEHEIARAPCGVMDQLTAACGEEGRLLSILCRPAEILESIPVEPPLAVWGIDSGVRHTVAGDDYRHIRCATFMGKQMLGLDAASYLTERTPSETATERVPRIVSGRAFLKRFGPVADPASSVDADARYPVRAATLHAIEEHQRVSSVRRTAGGNAE